MMCPKCGSENTDGSKFCSNCSAPLQEGAVTTKVKKPFYKKWWFWLLCILGVIIIATSINGKTDTEEEPATEEEPKQATSSDNIQIGNGTIGDYDVEIKDCTLSTDYEGKPVAIITYSWTNNDDTAQSFMAAIIDKAYQNDVECQRAFMSGDSNFDSNSETADIKPGITYEVQKAYELLDETSPLIVETTECFGFDNAVIRQTFEIAQ